MAWELRWRVRAAAGVDSGDELEDETGATVKKEEAANGAMEVDLATPVGGVAGSALGKKRRRQDAKPMFRNWQPPEWEKVENCAHAGNTGGFQCRGRCRGLDEE